ncbi:PREDICTED: ribosome biogenesis protein TSR3-like [Atta cephalotes]|uniref:RNase L inhibitor RLI-like possible metal-binding domain-containing protein n=1 Tax=Atta cephalotes TaxID=12957 RepID=A0A158NWK8_ATTCE|nr:PREDICTED: ribosome biogenesis protein TSR3-like [Atta cephalotes]
MLRRKKNKNKLLERPQHVLSKKQKHYRKRDDEGSDKDNKAEVNEQSINFPMAMWDMEHCDPKKCSGKKTCKTRFDKDPTIECTISRLVSYSSRR